MFNDIAVVLVVIQEVILTFLNETTISQLSICYAVWLFQLLSLCDKVVFEFFHFPLEKCSIPFPFLVNVAQVKDFSDSWAQFFPLILYDESNCIKHDLAHELEFILTPILRLPYLLIFTLCYRNLHQVMISNFVVHWHWLGESWCAFLNQIDPFSLLYCFLLIIKCFLPVSLIPASILQVTDASSWFPQLT